MKEKELKTIKTYRDEEYLRVIFLLNGSTEPVSPIRVARSLGVTKVSSYQKMRRLADMGFGKYLHGKGFLLNENGVKVVEKDIQRHHILEKFIQDVLNLSAEEACRESTRLGCHISDHLMRSISEKVGKSEKCECGYCFNPPYKPETLIKCHWCQSYLLKDRGEDR